MSEKWLICKMFKGMFSDELAVQYHDFSFFVPRACVQAKGDESAWLKVRVFNGDKSTWAVLPTDDQAIVPVAQGDLVGA